MLQPRPAWNSSTRPSRTSSPNITRKDQVQSRKPPPKPLTKSNSAELKRPVKRTTRIIGNTTEAFKQVLESKNANDKQLRESLKQLRNLILKRGIPTNTTKSMQQQLRTKVWKALLGVYKINAQEYIQLVRRGPSPMMDKIQNDTFRTLKTDEDFTNNVSQDSLTRLLNAFVWKAMDQPVSRLVNMRFSYVQGMNVLAAPFLYVMPELDAYSLFSSFLHHSCPLYVQPNLEGVHCGVKLVDHCLEELDPELYKHLIKHNLSAQVYAFPYIMTFSACVPPLDQVLVLWDFYFAFGMHLNVLGVVSQVVLMRQQLLNSDSPMKLLRTLPDLNAKKIIDKVLVLASSLDEDLYDLCVRHPFDPTIYDALFPGEF